MTLSALALLPLLLLMGGLASRPDVTPQQAKQNYAVVADHLDPGGTFYRIQCSLDAMEGLNAATKGLLSSLERDEAAGLVSRVDPYRTVLRESGLYDLQGQGGSVVAKGSANQSKVFWRIDEEARRKPLWQGLFGEPSDPSRRLGWLPAQTRAFLSVNADARSLWSLADSAILRIAAQGDREKADKLIAKPGAETVSPPALAESLTGKAVFSLQLNPDAETPFPAGANAVVQIPMPSFLAIFEVRDERFETALSKLLTQKGGFRESAQAVGERTARTFQPTGPTPIPVVVSLLRVGDHLLVGSNLGVVKNALHTAEEGGGVVDRAPFQGVFPDGVDQSHALGYLAPEAAALFNEVRHWGLVSGDAPNDLRFSLPFVRPLPEVPMGWSIRSDATGYLFSGFGTGGVPKALCTNGSAVVLPVLLQALLARSIAAAGPPPATKPCLDNLRTIAFAKEAWALETNAVEGAKLDWDDLAPYLPRGKIPRCPQGGTYSINAVGAPPTCSHPGHALP